MPLNIKIIIMGLRSVSASKDIIGDPIITFVSGSRAAVVLLVNIHNLVLNQHPQMAEVAVVGRDMGRKG